MLVRRLLIVIWLASLGGSSQPLAAQSASPVVNEGHQPDLVVVLHGLGRTPVSMLPLQWAIEAEGYEVMNWGYSSFCCSIADLGRQLQEDLRTHEAGASRTIHFVGHSLGNIIIRWLLTHENAPARVGNVVMLAPPNQGSVDADRYAPFLAWLLRPLPELQTDPSSTVRNLETVAGVPIGVIAGKYDGKVLPYETVLAEAADYVLVPATHTFLMFRRDVHRLTIGFLQEGRFPNREEPGGTPRQDFQGRSRP